VFADPFTFASLFAGLFMYGLLIAPVLLLALAIPYAILRLRDARSDQRDPQLGLKAGLYYFYSLGVLLCLNGLTVAVVDLVMDKRPGAVAVVDWFTPAQRVGWAMVTSGVCFALLHLAIIKGLTNDTKWPTPRRIFVGWRFAFHGLVVLFAFTALLVICFQKDFGDKNARNSALAVLLVWVPSWVLHLSFLRYQSRQLYSPRLPESTREVD
jgi:hypothetical protein